MNREPFEARYPVPDDAMYSNSRYRYVYKQYPNTDHPYSDLWGAWRDSRACIEVELPAKWYSHANPGDVIDYAETVSAIEAQGLRVKQ